MSLNTLCAQMLSSSMTGSAMTSSHFIPSPFLNALIEQWKNKVCAIVLFGSVVRKEETETSDIDLLLVLKEDIPINRELYREWDILPHVKEISPHFIQIPKDPLEVSGLWYEVAMEGIVLWYSDMIIFQILQKLRTAIAEGKIKRMFSHGHPYWIKLSSH